MNDTHVPVIFTALANAPQNYLPRLADESRQIRRVLDRAVAESVCRLIERQNATIDEIFEVFQEYRNQIAIFHFGGHANAYQLLLESAAGHSEAADARGLAGFVSNQENLQLVFLNGCSTQQQVEELLDANVNAVIATSQAIADSAATDFAARFYGGLASGASIGAAFAEAESQIKTRVGTEMRGLYLPGRSAGDRWPWYLNVRDGAEQVRQWSLADAPGAHLFGLPKLPEIDFPNTPYQFLQRFERAEAPVFFGRTREIRRLYETVTSHQQHIVLLYGQSGVGKSSLLQAGLLPRLEAACETHYLQRHADLSFADAFRGVFSGAGRAWDSGLWRRREEETGRPVTVILDQLEVVFTSPGAGGKRELDELLLTLQGVYARSENRPQGKLILAFRKEWLPEIDEALKLAGLPQAHSYLQRLDHQGVLAAIGLSPEVRDHYGLDIEPDLPETIAADVLRDPDSPVAPMTQIILSNLWEMATELNPGRPRFSREAYDRLKQHQGLNLDDFLGEQLMRQSSAHPTLVASGLALDILAFHTTDQGTSAEREHGAVINEYRHHDRHEIEQFLESCKPQLLADTSDPRRGAPRSTRLAHDTLAVVVRRQFAESDCPGQRARRILDRLNEEAREGIDPYLSELELSMVSEGRSGTRALSADEERWLAVNRDLHRSERTRRRWRRAIYAAFSLATVAAIGLGLFFWDRWERESFNNRQSQAKLQLQRGMSAVSDENYEQAPILLFEAAEGFAESNEVAKLYSLLQIADIVQGRLALPYKRFSLPNLKDAIYEEESELVLALSCAATGLTQSAPNDPMVNVAWIITVLDGNLRQQLQVHPVPSEDLDFWSEGNQLYVLSIGGDNGSQRVTLETWDLISGAKLRSHQEILPAEIGIHIDYENLVVLVPDVHGEKAELRKLVDGSVLQQDIPWNHGAIERLLGERGTVMLASNRFLALAGPTDLQLFETSSGTLIRRLQFDSPIALLQYGDAGTYFTVKTKSALHLYSAEDGQLTCDLTEVLARGTSEVRSASLTASGGVAGTASPGARTARLTSAQPPRQPRSAAPAPPPPPTPVDWTRVLFHPRDKLIGIHTGQAWRIFDLETMKLWDQEIGSLAIRFHPTEPCVFAQLQDFAHRIERSGSQTIRGEFKDLHDTLASAAATSTLVSVGHPDKSNVLLLWDFVHNRILAEITCSSTIDSSWFSADEQFFVAESEDGESVGVDVATGQQFRFPSDAENIVSFHGDRRVLLFSPTELAFATVPTQQQLARTATGRQLPAFIGDSRIGMALIERKNKDGDRFEMWRLGEERLAVETQLALRGLRPISLAAMNPFGGTMDSLFYGPKRPRLIADATGRQIAVGDGSALTILSLDGAPQRAWTPPEGYHIAEFWWHPDQPSTLEVCLLGHTEIAPRLRICSWRESQAEPLEVTRLEVEGKVSATVSPGARFLYLWSDSEFMEGLMEEMPEALVQERVEAMIDLRQGNFLNDVEFTDDVFSADAFVFAPSGRFFAVWSSLRREIEVWDLISETLLLQLPQQSPRQMLLTANGKSLVTLSKSGSLELRNIDGTPPPAIDLASLQFSAQSMAMDAQSSLLAACDGSRIRIWSMTAGLPICPDVDLQTTARQTEMSFSADGQFLMVRASGEATRSAGPAVEETLVVRLPRDKDFAGPKMQEIGAALRSVLGYRISQSSLIERVPMKERNDVEAAIGLLQKLPRIRSWKFQPHAGRPIPPELRPKFGQDAAPAPAPAPLLPAPVVDPSA